MAGTEKFDEEMDIDSDPNTVDTTPKEDEGTEEQREREAEEATTDREEGQLKEGVEEEVGEEDEEALGLPFPNAAVVRLIKANLDKEKMVKKEVKIGMNKWLGEICGKVAQEMNKNPYVMMGMHDFQEAKRVFDDLERFWEEKKRVLAHMEAIQMDVERLKKDLGAVEESEEMK